MKKRINRIFARVKNLFLKIYYTGTKRLCPVCGRSSRKFHRSKRDFRQDAQCVYCGSLERQRFAWLYLTKKTDLFDGKWKRMLHIAPEECFENKIRKQLGDDYITADLLNPKAILKMDITDIKYPDESFHVIYCSHVLEHIENDRKAISELFRVLRKNGWAIIMVPVNADKTFDDPAALDPQSRLRIFGHKGHVRRYGPDFADRLREAGFQVKVINVSDLFDEKEIIHMGLTPACGDLFYCVK